MCGGSAQKVSEPHFDWWVGRSAPPGGTGDSLLSCYTAKLYNPNILNSSGTGILPVPLIQIKCTTAYQ